MSEHDVRREIEKLTQRLDQVGYIHGKPFEPDDYEPQQLDWIARLWSLHCTLAGIERKQRMCLPATFFFRGTP